MTPSRKAIHPGACALSGLSTGGRARLVSIQGGHHLRARLAAMGLAPGIELTIIRKQGHGAFIVAIRGARFVLGRGMTDKLVVQPC